MLNSLRTQLFHVCNQRFFYGWVILAVTCFAMIGTGPGQSHLIGLYFGDISREMTFMFAADWMGANRQTAITFAYGGATFLAAFHLLGVHSGRKLNCPHFVRGSNDMRQQTPQGHLGLSTQ